MSEVLIEEIDSIEKSCPDINSPALAELHRLFEKYVKKPADLSFLVARYRRTLSPGVLNVLSFLVADKIDLLEDSTITACVELLEAKIRDMHDSSIGNLFVMLGRVAQQQAGLDRSVDWASVCKLVRITLESSHPSNEGIIAARDGLGLVVQLSQNDLLAHALSESQARDFLDVLRRYPFLGNELVAATATETEAKLSKLCTMG